MPFGNSNAESERDSGSKPRAARRDPPSVVRRLRSLAQIRKIRALDLDSSIVSRAPLSHSSRCARRAQDDPARCAGDTSCVQTWITLGPILALGRQVHVDQQFHILPGAPPAPRRARPRGQGVCGCRQLQGQDTDAKSPRRSGQHATRPTMVPTVTRSPQLQRLPSMMPRLVTELSAGGTRCCLINAVFQNAAEHYRVACVPMTIH